MKRILAIALSVLMLLALLAACSTDPDSGDSGSGGNAELTNEGTAINVFSFTDEVPNMIKRYKELNPDFNFTINDTIISTSEGAYQPALDQGLSAGTIDLYCAESAFVMKYTQGDAQNYALPYSALNITKSDTDAAQIAPYTIDIGTRGNDLVALAYQLTGGAMIYRRSIAKDVWNTDAPADIAAKVAGPGWDKFFSAAEELKAKNYAIVSGDGDIWHSIENSSATRWVEDGKLNIDPKREEFIDLSMRLKENGYHNDTADWTDPWYADMGGVGAKQVFAFFGPAWLINFTLSANAGDTFGDWAICEPPVGFFWGGTWLLAHKDTKMKKALSEFIKWVTVDTSDTGLQMKWASGNLFEGSTVFPDQAADYAAGEFTKDTVASGVVMGKADGTQPILGGQNMFDVFIPAAKFATGKNLTQYDETINKYYREEVRQYTAGAKTRDQAITDFKQMVADNLDVIVE